VKSSDRTNSARVQKVFSRLERICARLPETETALDKFGHTSYRIANKPFVILGEDQGKPSLSVKADLATQDVLVRGGQYYRTPYVGQHGWVTLRDDIAANWDEVEGLIRDAYKRVAPKRLVDHLLD
jgi:predicted DNA-binding protein (MmcQ/YjbR family)